MGDTVLRPCHLVFPLQTNSLVKLSQELPRGGNKVINEALAFFDIFRTQCQWTSMYLHDLRKLNVKKFDRHDMKENVILLDRAQQNHELCYGIITQVVTKHHLKVKVISRGMKLDKDYNMVKPAVTVELDRAPESFPVSDGPNY